MDYKFYLPRTIYTTTPSNHHRIVLGCNRHRRVIQVGCKAIKGVGQGNNFFFNGYFRLGLRGGGSSFSTPGIESVGTRTGGVVDWRWV
jgi:hypothetical protein